MGIAKRFLCLLLLSCLLGAIGVSALAEGTPQGVYKNLDEMDGKSIGILTGSVFDSMLREVLPDAVPTYIATVPDCLAALQAGKIDGFLVDEPVVRYMMRESPDVTYIPEVVRAESYAFAFAKTQPALRDQFSQAIGEMQADGTLAALETKWFEGAESEQVLPDIELTAENGVLEMAVSTGIVPFALVKDGRVVGYDIEIAMRICQKLGYGLEISGIDFGAIIPGLVSGRFDFAASCITVTEERKQSVLFAEPDYSGGVVMAVRRDETHAAAPMEFTQLAQLAGKKIASQTGTVFYTYIDQKIPDVEHVYFDSASDEAEALRAGKVDAIAMDEPVARLLVAQHPAYGIVEEMIEGDQYGFALPKDSPLTPIVSRIIQTFWADGTLAAMGEKWFANDEAGKVMPELTHNAAFDGSAGTLRFGHDVTLVPMCYTGSDGESLGFDLELAKRIAYELNMELEPVPMQFGALLPSLVSGKTDMVGGCMSITEERLKSVDFPDAYYKGGMVLVVRREITQQADDFWGDLGDSFHATFIKEDRYELILQGLWVTLQISVCAGLFGTALGFGICMMRRSRSRVLSAIAQTYIRILQGTPIVVLLMILFYLVFVDRNSDPVLVAIAGFGLNFAAYVSEMMRTGIEAVDKGQIEAAGAMGFRKAQVFLRITLPQAARHFLPVFKGEFISLVKMTSVVGYITIQDLTRISDIIRSRTYDAFFPLLSTALLYFMLASLLTALLSLLEVRVNPKHKKRTVKGVRMQ